VIAMMNILIATVVSVLSFCGVPSITPAPQDDTITKIAIKKWGWEVLTPINVACWEFDEMKLPVAIIRDLSSIHRILDSINTLESANNDYIDVRCKMYLYSSKEIVSSICIGSDLVFCNGSYYKLSQSLKDVVDSFNYTDTLVIEQYNSIERDKQRLVKYIESQSSRFSGLLTDSVAFFVRCRVDREGNCLEVRIGKNIYDNEKEPIRNVKILKDVIMEFKWSKCESMQEKDWIYIPIKLN